MVVDESERIKHLIENHLRDRGYSKKSKYYDIESNYLLNILDSSEKLISIIEYYEDLNFEGSSILDVGTGPGGLAILARKKGGIVSAIDIDKGRIKIAKEYAKDENVEINFIDSDFRASNLKKDFFDIIFCINLLEHTDSCELIDNLYSYLKPGGKLILKTPNKNFPFETHIKTFFIHYFPIKFVDFYLKKNYKSFFNDYTSFSEIKLLNYRDVKSLFKPFRKKGNFKIYPVFYPFFPNINKLYNLEYDFLKLLSFLQRSVILNKIFTSKCLNFCAQSWIITFQKGEINEKINS